MFKNGGARQFLQDASISDVDRASIRRRIVEIKNKKKADLMNEDYAHMRKVVG
jgi:hypothetical protein